MYIHKNKENIPFLNNHPHSSNLNKTTTSIPSSHRQFGNDITNTNLTAYLHINHEEKIGFLNAFETLKANQEKGKQLHSRPILEYHKRSRKNSVNPPTKDSQPKKMVPMFLQYKPKSKENIQNISFNINTINYVYPSLCITNPHIDNPQYVYEYQDDILLHLKSINTIAMPEWDYMKKQKDISNRMRAIVFDWLLKVCMSFKCRRDTIFITANILDRYLSHVQVPRTKLQLVSVSAFLIACKYEEIYVKDVKQFSYITNDSCSVKDILKKENEILQELDFEVYAHTPLSYLDFIAMKCKFNGVQIAQACYLLEMCLIEGDMKKYSPCLLALSAGMLVDRFQKKKMFEVFKDIVKEDSIEECVNMIIKTRQKVISGVEYFRSLQEKYSRDSYYNAAKYEYDVNLLNGTGEI